MVETTQTQTRVSGAGYNRNHLILGNLLGNFNTKLFEQDFGSFGKVARKTITKLNQLNLVIEVDNPPAGRSADGIIGKPTSRIVGNCSMLPTLIALALPTICNPFSFGRVTKSLNTLAMVYLRIMAKTTSGIVANLARLGHNSVARFGHNSVIGLAIELLQVLYHWQSQRWYKIREMLAMGISHNGLHY